MIFSWGFLNGTRLGELEGFWVKKIQMDPGWVIWKDFWLGILNGTRLGDLEGFLVRKWDDVLLGR